MTFGRPAGVVCVAFGAVLLAARGNEPANEAQADAEEARPAEQVETFRGPTETDREQARELRQRARQIQGF